MDNQCTGNTAPRGDEILHGSKGVNRRTASNTVRDNCVSFIYTSAYNNRSNLIHFEIRYSFVSLLSLCGPKISRQSLVNSLLSVFSLDLDKLVSVWSAKIISTKKGHICIRRIISELYLYYRCVRNIPKLTEATCWFSISIVTESWLRCYITWAWDIPVGGGNGMLEESRRPWHHNIWCAYPNSHRQ